MFNSIHNRFRELIRAGQVTISTHAEEEMDADAISSEKVLNVLKDGDITGRQRDRITGEWKYLFSGSAIGLQVVVVAKISVNNRVFIITVFPL